jgi:hypothetical protein
MIANGAPDPSLSPRVKGSDNPTPKSNGAIQPRPEIRSKPKSEIALLAASCSN